MNCIIRALSQAPGGRARHKNSNNGAVRRGSRWYLCDGWTPAIKHVFCRNYPARLRATKRARAAKNRRNRGDCFWESAPRGQKRKCQHGPWLTQFLYRINITLWVRSGAVDLCPVTGFDRFGFGPAAIVRLSRRPPLKSVKYWRAETLFMLSTYKLPFLHFSKSFDQT